jgi:hypothetical protein
VELVPGLEGSNLLPDAKRAGGLTCTRSTVPWTHPPPPWNLALVVTR